MTNMEHVLNKLAEISSTEISKSKNRKGFKEAEDSVKKRRKYCQNCKRATREGNR